MTPEDFWHVHSLLFVMGFVFWPRLMLLWLGILEPGSLGAIGQFVFLPRMTLALVVSQAHSDSNGGLVAGLWIIAILADLIGNLAKLHAASLFHRAQWDAVRNMPWNRRSVPPAFSGRGF